MNPLYQTHKNGPAHVLSCVCSSSWSYKERNKDSTSPRPEIGCMSNDSTLPQMLTWRMEAMYLSRGESDHDD